MVFVVRCTCLAIELSIEHRTSKTIKQFCVTWCMHHAYQRHFNRKKKCFIRVPTHWQALFKRMIVCTNFFRVQYEDATVHVRFCRCEDKRIEDGWRRCTRRAVRISGGTVLVSRRCTRRAVRISGGTALVSRRCIRRAVRI